MAAVMAGVAMREYVRQVDGTLGASIAAASGN